MASSKDYPVTLNGEKQIAENQIGLSVIDQEFLLM